MTTATAKHATMRTRRMRSSPRWSNRGILAGPIGIAYSPFSFFVSEAAVDPVAWVVFFAAAVLVAAAFVAAGLAVVDLAAAGLLAVLAAVVFAVVAAFVPVAAVVFVAVAGFVAAAGLLAVFVAAVFVAAVFAAVAVFVATGFVPYSPPPRASTSAGPCSPPPSWRQAKKPLPRLKWPCPWWRKRSPS